MNEAQEEKFEVLSMLSDKFKKEEISSENFTFAVEIVGKEIEFKEEDCFSEEGVNSQRNSYLHPVTKNNPLGQEIKEVNLLILQKLDEITRRLERVEKLQKMIVNHLKIASHKRIVVKRAKDSEPDIIKNVSPESGTSTSKVMAENNPKMELKKCIDSEVVYNLSEIEEICHKGTSVNAPQKKFFLNEYLQPKVMKRIIWVNKSEEGMKIIKKSAHVGSGQTVTSSYGARPFNNSSNCDIEENVEFNRNSSNYDIVTELSDDSDLSMTYEACNSKISILSVSDMSDLVDQVGKGICVDVLDSSIHAQSAEFLNDSSSTIIPDNSLNGNVSPSAINKNQKGNLSMPFNLNHIQEVDFGTSSSKKVVMGASISNDENSNTIKYDLKDCLSYKSLLIPGRLSADNSVCLVSSTGGITPPAPSLLIATCDISSSLKAHPNCPNLTFTQKLYRYPSSERSNCLSNNLPIQMERDFIEKIQFSENEFKKIIGKEQTDFESCESETIDIQIESIEPFKNALLSQTLKNVSGVPGTMNEQTIVPQSSRLKTQDKPSIITENNHHPVIGPLNDVFSHFDVEHGHKFVDVIKPDYVISDATNNAEISPLLAVPDDPTLPNKKNSRLKTCPLCNTDVKYLSKHLVNHNIDTEDKYAILYAQRKRRSPVKKNVKLRFCPFNDCKGLKPHSRLDHHLKQKHELNAKDPYYRQIIKGRNICNNIDICKNKTKVMYSDFSQAECNRFKKYLRNLNGKNLSERESKQTSYRLRQILHGTNVKELDFILNSECSLAVERWLQLYCEKHECSSAITYCCSWISYLNFLREKNFSQQYVLIRAMIDDANNWRHSFRKIGSLKYKCIEQINVESVITFRKGEVFKNGIDILLAFKKGRQSMITRVEYSKLRNCLFLASEFRNADWPSTLSNLTVSELNNAVSFEDKKYGHCFIAKVHNHAGFKHESAEVVLFQEYYELYLSYKLFIRPQLVMFNVCDGLESSFFVTWSGKSITSDDLIHGIKTTLTSSEPYSKLKTVSIPEEVTSIVPKNNNALEMESVATHFKHGISTALSHGKEHTTLMLSLGNSKMEKEQLTEPLQPPEPLLPVEIITVNSVNNSNNSKNYSLNSTMPLNIQTKVNFLVENEVEENMAVNSPQIETMNKSVIKREKGNPYYNLEERRLLNIVFKEYIERNQVPKLSTIRDIVKKDQRLVSLVLRKKCEDKKVKGALQNLVNKKLKLLKKMEGKVSNHV